MKLSDLICENNNSNIIKTYLDRALEKIHDLESAQDTRVTRAKILKIKQEFFQKAFGITEQMFDRIMYQDSTSITYEFETTCETLIEHVEKYGYQFIPSQVIRVSPPLYAFGDDNFMSVDVVDGPFEDYFGGNTVAHIIATSFDVIADMSDVEFVLERIARRSHIDYDEEDGVLFLLSKKGVHTLQTLLQQRKGKSYIIVWSDNDDNIFFCLMSNGA